jgi:hypothetical protein
MNMLDRDRGKTIDEIVKAAVADLSEEQRAGELVHAETS